MVAVQIARGKTAKHECIPDAIKRHPKPKPTRNYPLKRQSQAKTILKILKLPSILKT
jgi:hypothetical protein